IDPQLGTVDDGRDGHMIELVDARELAVDRRALERATHPDATQPARERRPALQPAEVAVRAQPGLLTGVLGFPVVAQHSADRPEQPSIVATHQQRERGYATREHAA